MWEKGCSFGDINIGDDKEKLRSILGEPDNTNNTQWQYVLDGDIIIQWRQNLSHVLPVAAKLKEESS